jgi:zeaxanthin glucosyltransferase
MAVIAVLVDLEHGHIFPTFCLAKKLMARGHRVCYLGLVEVEHLIRRQGLEFRPIMQDLIPPGFFTDLRAQGIETGRQVRASVEEKYFAPLLQGKVLDGVMQEIKPDVMLITCHQYFEAIAVHYKYNVPVILLNTQVRDETRAQGAQVVIQRLIEVPGATDLIDLLLSSKVRIKGFADVAALVLQMPELVLFPRAFELGRISQDPLVFYVGHEVDLNRSEEPFCWGELRSDRPLIYCSLGSELDLKSEISRRFIRTVIDAVVPRPDWQLVISLGSRLDAEEFGPMPAHVLLTPWVPQLQMLARASVMITHAGIGTVKECIIYGVPMLAVPLMRDQFRCAERIVHHGLGLRGDIEHLESEDLSSMLEQLIADEACKERLEAMREEFQRAEALDLSVSLIERIALGCSAGSLLAPACAGSGGLSEKADQI